MWKTSFCTYSELMQWSRSSEYCSNTISVANLRMSFLFWEDLSNETKSEWREYRRSIKGKIFSPLAHGKYPINVSCSQYYINICYSLSSPNHVSILPKNSPFTTREQKRIIFSKHNIVMCSVYFTSCLMIAAVATKACSKNIMYASSPTSTSQALRSRS